MKSIPVIGTYTALDFQRAMREALMMRNLRVLKPRRQWLRHKIGNVIGADVKADGVVIPL